MSPSRVQISSLENSSQLQGDTDININRKGPVVLLGLITQGELAQGWQSPEAITGYLLLNNPRRRSEKTEMLSDKDSFSVLIQVAPHSRSSAAITEHERLPE